MPAVSDVEAFAFEAHHGRTLSLALYTNVQNAKDIRANVIAGKICPDYAFINAEVVVDTYTMHLAAHRVLVAERLGRLQTRSLHAELVFCISGSKHIAESLKRFGVGDDSKHLLVARFDATAEEMAHLGEVVQGELVPLQQLQAISSSTLIAKYYKVSAEELKVGSAADAVALRIASKECQ